MIPENAFERLLGLDEGWEVSAAEYETEPVERFLLVIHERLIKLVSISGGSFNSLMN